VNIKTLLSVLAIIVALFIGGVMAYINDAPNWSYILWGLAGILLIISLVTYFVQKHKKFNPNIRWLD